MKVKVSSGTCSLVHQAWGIGRLLSIWDDCSKPEMVICGLGIDWSSTPWLAERSALLHRGIISFYRQASSSYMGLKTSPLKYQSCGRAGCGIVGSNKLRAGLVQFRLDLIARIIFQAPRRSSPRIRDKVARTRIPARIAPKVGILICREGCGELVDGALAQSSPLVFPPIASLTLHHPS